MGAKAKRDKSSILADAKNFLSVLLPALQNVPKIERIEGAAHEMKVATFDLIAHFNTAFNCPEVRLQYIHLMFGDFGRILAAFEIAIAQGILTDSAKLNLSIHLEKIEGGVTKWYNAVREIQSQEHG